MLVLALIGLVGLSLASKGHHEGALSSYRSAHTVSVSAPTSSTSTKSSRREINGTVGLTPPRSFVKVDGHGFKLDGKPFSFVGPNVYWLVADGSSETGVDVQATYTSKAQVDLAMAMAVAMGGTAIRTGGYTTIGTNLSIQTSIGVYNEEALRHADYVVYAASRYGLRIIIHLVDN